VLAAVLKPWTWGVPAASGPIARLRPAPTASPGPRPTEDRSPEGLAAAVCLGTDAWRIASVETWRLIVAGHVEVQQVRVWRAISPIDAASGPLDPGIPRVVVAGTQVDALGWCAPDTVDRPSVAPVVVTAWRLTDDGARADAISVRRVAPTGGETAFAALYREVIGCTFDAAGFGQQGSGAGCSTSAGSRLAPTWAAGQVVFRYASADGETWWFGADVEILPPPTAPPLQASPGP
jgi:hypothetical protein